MAHIHQSLVISEADNKDWCEVVTLKTNSNISWKISVCTDPLH